MECDPNAACELGEAEEEERHFVRETEEGRRGDQETKVPPDEGNIRKGQEISNLSENNKEGNAVPPEREGQIRAGQGEA